MQEGINQAKKELDLRSDVYLKSIVDFFKWTITVTVVVMLWIADNLDGLKLFPKVLVVIALFCFLASVAIAIVAVTRMNIAFAKDWGLAIANSNILQNQILKTTLLSIVPAKELAESFERKEREMDKEKWETLKSSEPFSKPEGYNRLAKLYAVFLIAGLALYIFAQALNAFF